MSLCDRVFLSEEEARKYFLEQKVEYYKHKQRYSKALSDGKVDLRKMKIFEEILGTDMTSSDIKPYYYELVGVAEIEVKWAPNKAALSKLKKNTCVESKN